SRGPRETLRSPTQGRPCRRSRRPTARTWVGRSSFAPLARDLLGEVFPVARPAIRVARGRLRRLRLEPAHGRVAAVVGRVRAADAGPEEIAGSHRILLVVRPRLDLAVQQV